MMPASVDLMITLSTLTDDERSKLACDPTTASEVLVALAIGSQSRDSNRGDD